MIEEAYDEDEYEVLGAAAKYHSQTIRRCSEHAGLSGEALYQAAREQNTRVMKVFNAGIANLGFTIEDYRDETFQWWFTGTNTNRTLHVYCASLDATQRATLQSLADSIVGTAKVVIESSGP